MLIAPTTRVSSGPRRRRLHVLAGWALLGLLVFPISTGSMPSLAAGTPTPVVLHFSPRSQGFGDIYGLGSYIAQRYPHYAGPAIRRLKRTGVHWVREEFTASDLHRSTDSRYNFEPYDRVVQRERASGLRILAILDYSNSWNSSDHVTMTHADIKRLTEDYVRYARAMVKHYHYSIRYWQVWNEPDIRLFWRPRPNPADYAYLLRKTYAAIKKLEPDARIVMAGTAGTDLHPLSFIRKVMKAGGKFDVASLQPYTTHPNLLLSDTIRQLRHMTHKPVWLTEMGWAAQQGCGPCGRPRQQARRLSTVYLVAALGGAKRVIWYDFRDDGLGHTFADHFGLLEYDFSGKPAYLAFEVGLYFLDNAKLIGEDDSQPGVVFYRLKNHGRHFFAVWNSLYYRREIYVRWSGVGVRALDCTGDLVARLHDHILHLTLPAGSVQYLAPGTFKPPIKLPTGIKVPPGHTR